MSRPLRTREAADRLGVEPTTLRMWRSRDYGPISFKLGRSVMYDPDDLDAWIAAQKAATAAGDGIAPAA